MASFNWTVWRVPVADECAGTWFPVLPELKATPSSSNVYNSELVNPGMVGTGGMTKEEQTTIASEPPSPEFACVLKVA